MKRAYVIIGSYYGGGELNRLLATLPSIFDEAPGYSWNVLLNRQFERAPRGYATVYNQLAHAAFRDQEAEFVWLVNDDVLPERRAFGVVMDAMARDESIASMSPMEQWTSDDGQVADAIFTCRGAGIIQEAISSYVSCACISRQAWSEIGPLDDSLGKGYCEDLDWSIRAWMHGFRVTVHRGVHHLHHRQMTLGRLINAGLLANEDNGQLNNRFLKKWPFVATESEEQIFERLRRKGADK